MDLKDVLAIVASICAIVFGYLAFFRNRRQDDTEEGRNDGEQMAKLGYISAGVDDIKAELKDQRKTNIEVVSRLTAVEESAKQAHKRIDELAHKGGQ